MIDNDTIMFTPDTLAPVNKVPACLKRLPKPKPVNVRELHADVFEDTTHITSILSGDTLFVERGGAGYGEQGEPIPYNIANDNFITSLLLICFLLTLFSSAQSHRFIVRQAKNFFYTPKVDQGFTETGTEIKFQIVFLVITSLYYALLFYFFATRRIAETFILSSEYGLLAIFAFMIFGYFLLKGLLYTLVNNIFFERKKWL